ncbi:MAG: hypothetical protein ACREH4_08725 [Vitreimonas sp.]
MARDDDPILGRLAAAVGLTPVILAALLAIVLTTAALLDRPIAAPRDWRELAMFGLGTLAWATVALLVLMLLFGAPLHGALAFARLTHWLSYCLGGMTVGAGLPLLLGVLHIFDFLHISESEGEPLRGVEASLGIAVMGGLVGLTMALTFWLIRRPDRDQTPASPSNDTSA